MNFWLIFLNELRIARRDPGVFAILFAMPFVALYLLSPAMRPALIQEGFANATGAEQAMPGMSVLFGNFAMAFLAFSIFREHTWNTWERLRLSPLSKLSIFLGKALLPFTLLICQQLLLLLAARLIFGVEMQGSIIAFLAISMAFAFFTMSLGFLFTALLNSMQEINAFINVGALLFAGIGGAFAPLKTLPYWIQKIAFLSPNYWAIQGLKDVILKGTPLSGLFMPLAILTLVGLCCLSLAFYKFNSSSRKETWA
ncbi:MAG: ABC transporter permease [Spirochaetota bacterium]